MQWQQRLKQTTQDSLHELLKETHGRIVLCGLLVGLWYLPAWLGVLFHRMGRGSSSLVLLLAIVYLGLQELWKQRKQLAKSRVSDADRFLGHALILAGIVLFPFCRFAIWSQALVWLIVLIGIACSSWGGGFFRRHALPTALMGLSVYPRPGETAKIMWEIFTPPRMLDRLTAWVGSGALHVIGQPAKVTNDVFISLPTGSVEVGWGCNGFGMATNIAIGGLILGLFLKQSWFKIILLMTLGTLLAFVLNVPRVMLVTYAAVYWGKYWFDFWHTSWGAQIFVAVLFTIYYYLVMAIVNRSPKKMPV
ncbi:MAG: cyanoexosortase C [Lyngbya sp. HA4199-MV5]|jgi:exosortase/archaeosortase family protein|nr:cyanoexosortase C [Lyngbya sp. HA4199-MV5]